ncbi:MAG: M48 family metallopeptidase [Salibacteraceae bacterium]
MKQVALTLAVILLMSACGKVPITGRKQINLLPETTLMSMSVANYQEFLSTNKTLSSNANNQAQMVQRVGQRIASAVETYLKKHGQGKRVKDYKWEFNLVQDDAVNAWCMPGGKVVFYTGILPVTKDEEGLAVVMGHEIAHAIARHGNERMSQTLAVQAGGVGLGVAMSEKPELTQNLFMQAYGLGSNLGMLAFSRSHESESDKMGLVFMALAGYNPEAAVGFWQRMAALGGQAPPEFLSTHPSHDTRIQNIREFLPEAKKYYTPK